MWKLFPRPDCSRRKGWIGHGANCGPGPICGLFSYLILKEIILTLSEKKASCFSSIFFSVPGAICSLSPDIKSQGFYISHNRFFCELVESPKHSKLLQCGSCSPLWPPSGKMFAQPWCILSAAPVLKNVAWLCDVHQAAGLFVSLVSVCLKKCPPIPGIFGPSLVALTTCMSRAMRRLSLCRLSAVSDLLFFFYPRPAPPPPLPPPPPRQSLRF